MTRFVTFVIVFGFLLGSNANSSPLPPCAEEVEEVKVTWNDCIGTVFYSNGDKYIGAFKEGARSGKGKYTYSNGNKYIGQWKKGKKNGKGVFIYFNGSKYSGDFVNGKLTGKGTLTNHLGDVYVGEIKDGKRHGKGVITSANGYIFEGMFSNDAIVTGAGRITKSATRSERPANLCPGARNARCPRPPKKKKNRFLGAERSGFNKSKK